MEDKYRYNGEVDLDRTDNRTSRYEFNCETEHNTSSDNKYRFNGEVD